MWLPLLLLELVLLLAVLFRLLLLLLEGPKPAVAPWLLLSPTCMNPPALKWLLLLVVVV
jgi:hypothetical protein